MSLAVVHAAPTPPQHRPSPDLRTAVADLRKRYKRADADELAERLAVAVTEDGVLLKEACVFVVQKISSALDARVRRQQAAPSGRERIARKAAEREQVKATVAKVCAKVLDLTMPVLEKQLRFCTFGEIGTLGGGFQRLAAAGPVDVMCGEILTDQQAAELLQLDSAA
jgi:hypothetical protein